MSVAYLRREPAQALPPPTFARGPVAWMREHLFGGAWSALLTVGSILFLIWTVPDMVRYLFTDAIWSGGGDLCRKAEAGACWSFVRQNLPFFIYGSYPQPHRWRVDLWMAIGAGLITWLLWPNAPRRSLGAVLFIIVYPIITYVLLSGVSATPGALFEKVPTNLWGGVFVSLLVAVVGIVFSLPAGVLLALGRRSKLPIIKLFSVIFIEFVRGVPLITVLFMANTMLPLFVPEHLSPDRLLRPLIGVALFSAAYMAEVIRGGLQAMPKGQFEGAMALGLNYPKMMRLIILPQALTMVIPGIVNTFIGLFKDTTLVAIVGIYDFLRAIETRRLDPEWAGGTTSTTGYVFAAMFYFVFCWGMSRYSLYMERKLAAGKRR
ncbi:MAG: amino acid ABC transporter permease [Methylobacteriaceae bacterium]|nr:amino acid ABC transporter permease [Methylobacteriaceae bacterium]